MYVYDIERLGRFTLNGEFLDYMSRVPSGTRVAFSVQKLRAGPGHLLFPHDILPYNQSDAARPGMRTFQILEPAEDSSRLVFELPLTPLAQEDGVVIRPPRQAHPLWDVYGGCIFFSDGESDWALRHVLTSGVTDTLDLLHHNVPDVAEEELERAKAAGEESLRAAGAAGSVRAEIHFPTALERWDRLAVDPDGNLWIRPWQPHSEDGSFIVDIVNVATGEATTVTLPAFPDAFGEPGAFYAVEKDPVTDIDLIRRYELRGGPGGGP
ncbi:MAG: hypothetical protein RQ745_11750 [Longimicrobiales bacterium]|nr:hypothetical protein [Longimicrobiales bacterium]